MDLFVGCFKIILNANSTILLPWDAYWFPMVVSK